MIHGTMSLAASQAEPRDDAEVLKDAYLDFRSCLVRSLRAAGIAPQSGAKISKQLKLTRQLSWQLSTIIDEGDVAKGIVALPGTRGLALLANAVRAHSAERAAELQTAIDHLEESIRTLAGERARLELLTAAWGPDGLDARSELLRREACRVQSVLLGASAGTKVRGIIIAPSPDDPMKLLVGTYTYFVDLVRYRGDRRCRLAHLAQPWRPDGEPDMPAERMREYVENLYRLCPEFSTVTDERIEILTQGNRGSVTLAPAPLGATNAVSLGFIGKSTHQIDRYAGPEGGFSDIGQISCVPAEMWVSDVLATREIAEEANLSEALSAACFDGVGGPPMSPATPNDPAFLYGLDSKEEISPDIFDVDPSTPTLTNLIDKAAQGVGVRAEDLIGYRFTTNYTLAGTLIMTMRQLPPQR